MTKNYCAHCGEEENLTDLDDSMLCAYCQRMDLMQCASCGDSFEIEDMADDDCMMCIANYRR